MEGMERLSLSPSQGRDFVIFPGSSDHFAQLNRSLPGLSHDASFKIIYILAKNGVSPTLTDGSRSSSSASTRATKTSTSAASSSPPPSLSRPSRSSSNAFDRFPRISLEFLSLFSCLGKEIARCFAGGRRCPELVSFVALSQV